MNLLNATALLMLTLLISACGNDDHSHDTSPAAPMHMHKMKAATNMVMARRMTTTKARNAPVSKPPSPKRAAFALRLPPPAPSPTNIRCKACSRRWKAAACKSLHAFPGW